MRVSDQRKILLDELKHDRFLNAIKESMRVHEMKREIDLERETKTREKRAQALIMHEEINHENREARVKQNENHLAFLKLSTLNVI